MFPVELEGAVDHNYAELITIGCTARDVPRWPPITVTYLTLEDSHLNWVFWGHFYLGTSLLLILNYYRLSSLDVDHDVSTAYCWSSSGVSARSVSVLLSDGTMRYWVYFLFWMGDHPQIPRTLGNQARVVQYTDIFMIYYVRVTKCLLGKTHKQNPDQIVLNKVLRLKGTSYDTLSNL